MMAKRMRTSLIPAARIEQAILLVRGQKVLVDADSQRGRNPRRSRFHAR
jgi:hypothetical protein